MHPNDHVNASQSSNDTFPTSIHVAATSATVDRWCPRSTTSPALEAKAAEFADMVKSGRTHLMDATPVMLGQELGGYAAACATASSGSRLRSPGLPSCPSAARRSAPASTPRPGSRRR